jgi:hypothetical protein
MRGRERRRTRGRSYCAGTDSVRVALLLSLLPVPAGRQHQARASLCTRSKSLFVSTAYCGSPPSLPLLCLPACLPSLLPRLPSPSLAGDPIRPFAPLPHRRRRRRGRESIGIGIDADEGKARRRRRRKTQREKKSEVEKERSLSILSRAVRRFVAVTGVLERGESSRPSSLSASSFWSSVSLSPRPRLILVSPHATICFSPPTSQQTQLAF